MLRLPFAAEGAPEEGYATTVVLPLRSEAAYDLAHRLLTEIAYNALGRSTLIAQLPRTNGVH